ncbi:MAG: protein translocase subunit SecD [bacterium]
MKRLNVYIYIAVIAYIIYSAVIFVTYPDVPILGGVVAGITLVCLGGVALIVTGSTRVGAWVLLIASVPLIPLGFLGIVGARKILAGLSEGPVSRRGAPARRESLRKESMEKSLIYRLILVGVVILVAAVALVPTFFHDYKSGKSKLPEWWLDSSILPSGYLNLGLDLQGGMDLVVSVDVEEAVLKELQHFRQSIQDFFSDKDVDYEQVRFKPAEKRIEVSYPDHDSMVAGNNLIHRSFRSLRVMEGMDTLSPSFGLKEDEKRELQSRTVEQIRNIMSRRINAFGLQEPEIAVQGQNRIRLQLPGAKDPERVKDNITRTAKLDFMLVKGVGQTKERVEEAMDSPPSGFTLVTWRDPTEAGKTQQCYINSQQLADIPMGENAVLPPSYRLAVGTESREGVKREVCYLLREDIAVSGANLQDARPRFTSDQPGGGAVVSFRLNTKGARKFGKLTGEHVGERLAIVLEGQVESAPSIRSQITYRGQIEGNFSPQEATDLSTVLRSGALEVDIDIEEERTVGASLGADAVRKGKQAIFWGMLVVVLFMVVYYRGAGLITDLALVLNIVLIMAALSLLGATLTLPGIAGIVLTVGMAVDANVLIFERVREELRTGKTPQASIEAGYAKALWTILDANITTLIAALVLLQWGTGPIKGFAVTLALGIVSSLFTALVVTRIIYDLGFQRRKRKASLSIGIKLQPVEQGRKR